jgi:putative ABC transport system ATP-binding protein
LESDVDETTEKPLPVSNAKERLFSTRSLTKIYRTGDVEVRALNGVDLDLFEREILVLLGPSGSGKSTLLNILGGLDRPTSGSVMFKNDELTQFDEAALTRYRRRHVGFVFQFYNLVPSLTARENVELVTEISENAMSPEEALRLVGLGTRMDHFPSQMSGGEQQRVAIARAIAKRPEVLLCDEPTGALDSKTGILVLEALIAVSQSVDTTMIIITHNAAIQQIANRVAYFADGRITEVKRIEKRLQPSEISW